MSDKSNGVPAPALSEVVLKTGNFDTMKEWYIAALDRDPFFVRPRPEKASWTLAQQVAFFRIHGEFPYSQVLAIFEVDGTTERPGIDPGLHHYQLAHGCFDDLFARYDHMKSLGILPDQTWNHGVSTSFYYKDPDGNLAEMNCANFPTEDAYMAYFASDAYKKNISGIKIVADDFIAKYRGGMPQSELVIVPA